MKILNEMLNWRKNPKNVFILTVPLALLGVLLMFVKACLEFIKTGDVVYLSIFVAGMLILFVSLIPAFKMHSRNSKIKKAD